MPAVRNIKLCTKDCLCLFVCPTGATDTEDGQIDAQKCLSGCRICVDACTSHAISLVPDTYPPQQKKSDAVRLAMLSLAKKKVEQEKMAEHIAQSSTDDITHQFAQAISKSNRMMAEDVLRESGYMLPQSQVVQALLQSLLDSKQPDGFPREIAIELLNELKNDNIKKRRI
jgi:Fe-S-cluster-containing hydrogenase component 2